VQTADGTHYRLGYTLDAEAWHRAGTPNQMAEEGHPGYEGGIDNFRASAFAWYVDTVTDAFGNQMQYEYATIEYEELIDGTTPLSLTTHKGRILRISYNYPDQVPSQDLPPIPAVERLSSTPASRIEFKARNVEDPWWNESDPITNIFVYHGSLTTPITEYRIEAHGVGVASLGCSNNAPDPEDFLYHHSHTLQLDSITQYDLYLCQSESFSERHRPLLPFPLSRERGQWVWRPGRVYLYVG
jgi:hypothetical protein